MSLGILSRVANSLICSISFSGRYLAYRTPNSVDIPICACSNPRPLSMRDINSLKRTILVIFTYLFQVIHLSDNVQPAYLDQTELLFINACKENFLPCFGTVSFPCSINKANILSNTLSELLTGKEAVV